MRHDRPAREKPARSRAAALGAAALAALGCGLLLVDGSAPGGSGRSDVAVQAESLPSAADASQWGGLEPAPPPPARAPQSLEAGAGDVAQADEAAGSTATEDCGPSRPPIPGTERAWYETYRSALRQPGTDVQSLLDTTIRGGGPDAQKVGLLRALLDARAPGALQALVLAAEQVEPRDGPSGAGVPEFCVRTLVERAASEADARAALLELVARRAGAMDQIPGLRRTAAARVALTGAPSELAVLAAELRGCQDSELLLGVARSLEHNPDAAVVEHLFTDLPAVVADGEPRR